MRGAVEACTHADVLGHGDLNAVERFAVKARRDYLHRPRAGRPELPRLRHRKLRASKLPAASDASLLSFVEAPAARPAHHAPPTRASWRSGSAAAHVARGGDLLFVRGRYFYQKSAMRWRPSRGTGVKLRTGLKPARLPQMLKGLRRVRRRGAACDPPRHRAAAGCRRCCSTRRAAAAASGRSHLRQGREAPRGRAHNSAETPWQLSISIVKTRTELHPKNMSPSARRAPLVAIGAGRQARRGADLHLLHGFRPGRDDRRGAKVVGWPRA